MTVRLHCHVENLYHHTVTWIRQMDLEILSAGQMKVSTDPRIRIDHQLSYHPRSQDFLLEINSVDQRDAGLYECQINMLPIKSFIINLVIDDSVTGSSGSGAPDERNLSGSPSGPKPTSQSRETD